MISERKKLMALLDLRQRLEQDYDMSRDESIQQSLDAQLPALLNYFKCDTPEALRSQYPTTLDMRTAAESKRYFAPRTASNAPLRTAEVYNHLRREGSQEDYLGFVRVSKAVFINLVTSVLSQHTIFKNASNNGQESIEKQVAITLWRMGHYGKEAGIGEASHIFGLSEGTIMKCTQRCMMAFKELSQDVITWPTPGEKNSLKVRIKSIADNAAMGVVSPATTTTTASPSSSSLSSSSSSSSLSSALSSSSPSSSRQRGRAANVGISDAVGILSRMNVFLVVRPMVKDTAEYLIPLPESVKESVKSLPLPPVATTSTLARSRSALSLTTTESESATVTSEADAGGASSAPKRRSKRLKTTQSSSSAGTEDADTSASIPKKRVRKSRISQSNNDTMTENEPATAQAEATTKRKTRGRGSKASPLETTQDINTPESATTTTTSMDTASGTANVALETDAKTPTQEDQADSPSSTSTAVSTLESSSSSTATASVTKKKRGRSHALVKSAYLKRDYGYNVLFVCDSTTRIRFADVTRPASWSDQRVLESSQLLKKSEKLIAEDEYLVAESTFSPGKNIISSYPASEPTENPKLSTAMEPSTETSNNSATTSHDETTSSGTTAGAGPEDDIESRRQFNEIMDHLHKRGQDCQRKLLARFPSLLGLRVQLKDDQAAGASQENARNWMLACMTIHNLVLGDDSSYKTEWETQLEEIQSIIRKQQEHQARLMWKMEHFPSKKEPKPLPPQQQNQGLDVAMNMGTEFPKLKVVPLHQQLQYPTPRQMAHPAVGGAGQDAVDTGQQTRESTAAAIEQLLRLNDINTSTGTSTSGSSMMDGVTGTTPVIQDLGTGAGTGIATETRTGTETGNGGKVKEAETPMSAEEKAQSLAVGMKRREQICANIRSLSTHPSLSSPLSSSSSSRSEPSKSRTRL